MIRDAILRNLFSATVLMVLGLHCASAGAADAQTLRAGDIATVLFPLITFGIANAKDDVEGEKQWLSDIGVNEFLNTGLRVAFNGTSWGKRPDGSRVDAAQLAEAPERPGLVGLGERPRIWRSGNNCHSGGGLDGGVGGTYHLVARMPSA
jgi:hypothetical protein